MAIDDRDGMRRAIMRDEATGAYWLAGLAAVVLLVLGFAWGFAPGPLSETVPGVNQEAPIVRDPAPPANGPMTVPSPVPNPSTPAVPQ